MQTLQNGIKVPTNSDAYNPTADLAAMGKSANVIIPVNSQAARDNLTDKFVGMTVRRLDFRGTLEWWNGSSWESRIAKAYTPIWTGALDFGSGGEMIGVYWVDGDHVGVKARVTFGQNGALGANPIYCPLPPGYPVAGIAPTTLGTGFHVTAAGIARPLVVSRASDTSAAIWAPTIPVQTPGQAAYPTGQNDFMDISLAYQTSAV
jgi:hypothetical protein